MKTNELVIVCSDIEALIIRMKADYNFGYGVCESIEVIRGMYRATLSRGADIDYVNKLNSFNVDKDDLSSLVRDGDRVIVAVDKVVDVGQDDIIITKRTRSAK